jgi:hypothetical protein
MWYRRIEMAQNTARAILACFVAVAMVVAFTAAPAAAADDSVNLDGLDDGLDIDLDEDLGVDLDEDVNSEQSGDSTAGGLQVSITETNSPIDVGDTLKVTAELEQQGAPAPETVELSVVDQTGSETTVDSAEVVVEDDDDIVLTWETSPQDFGDYEAVVSSETSNDSEDVTVGLGNNEPFPESICTDVPETAGSEIPFEQVPWVTDLPPEAQPPGVPWEVVTPAAIYGIASGAAPNQCEVQDPNDPSYNPVTGNDSVDPDASVEPKNIGQWNGGPLVIVDYGVTLNESGDGPGASGTLAAAANPEFGDVSPSVRISDGEKEYAVAPRVRYWDDGTAYAETDVTLYGNTLGVTLDCDGEECQPGTKGLPNLVGYPAIPAPTGQDGGENDGQGGPFPESICTDVPERAGNNIPFEQAPWVTDLPPEAQPPGVPWEVVTPAAIYGIASGAAPNQCEVQDPNDPSYNPVTGNDSVDPDASVEPKNIGQWNGGPLVIVDYGVTLNESGDGPGASGTLAAAANPEFGDVSPSVRISDGEKEYAVAPRVRYWDDGTAYAETDVTLYGNTLGVTLDCDGEECQPGTKGLPNLVGYPAIPAPTGQD